MNAETAQLTVSSQIAQEWKFRPSWRISKQTVRLGAYGALAAIDLLAITLAMAFASYARHGKVLTEESFPLLSITLVVFLGVALNSSAYTLRALESCRYGVRRVTVALLFAITIAALVAFFFKTSEVYSRFVVGLGGCLSLLLLASGRLAFDRFVKRVLRWHPLDQLIIADGAALPSTFEAPMLHAGDSGLRPDLADPLMLDRIGRATLGRDRVIVACPAERRAEWALILKGANINGFVLAPEMDPLGLINIDHFGGSSLLRISCGPLDLRSRALKRAFDLVGCAFAITFFAPLLLLAAIAIKLDTPGPVLFRQERVGRGNRLFMIFKFRSMRVEACDRAGNVSTRRDDDRITRVGRLIRATSVDELPQLFNVLLGDMSFVGPRPHALGSTAGDRLFWEVDRRYWSRHATKPGITGLAQVRGFRGATPSHRDLESRLQADLEYIAGWTIWRDMAILLRTLKVVTHKNAF